MAGKLYLIPCPIVEYHIDTIPPETIRHLHKIKHFVVERARTARRYISKSKPPYTIDSLEILEMDKHSDQIHAKTVRDWLKAGNDVGVISESGCPGIADPGSRYVHLAHREGFQVVPLVGPSSIVMSLMASGLSGQNFAFLGYLPVQEKALKSRLKEIEKRVLSEGQTQIFIETPYRNDKLLKSLIKYVTDSLNLTIAMELTGPKETIISQSINMWKSSKFTIGKHNCIFILGKV